MDRALIARVGGASGVIDRPGVDDTETRRRRRGLRRAPGRQVPDHLTQPDIPVLKVDPYLLFPQDQFLPQLCKLVFQPRDAVVVFRKLILPVKRRQRQGMPTLALPLGMLSDARGPLFS
jgi:hypothetical protein